MVLLDHLRAADFSTLISVFQEIGSSNIDAVDIVHESPLILTEEYVLSMIRTINHKLRLVELRDVSFGKDFFWFVLWFPSITIEKNYGSIVFYVLIINIYSITLQVFPIKSFSIYLYLKYYIHMYTLACACTCTLSEKG